MAKPLNERIASARSTDRVTITDLRALIAETGEETERLRSIAHLAESDSVDIALSEPDRDQAAQNAGRASRLIDGYSAALAELERKLADKLESEGNQRRVAEQAAAKAERDALADRWREAWPRLTGEIVALFEASLANEDKLKAVGLDKEPSAEAAARGLRRNFMAGDGSGFVAPLTQMKIVTLAGHPRLWPPMLSAQQGQALRQIAEMVSV